MYALQWYYIWTIANCRSGRSRAIKSTEFDQVIHYTVMKIFLLSTDQIVGGVVAGVVALLIAIGAIIIILYQRYKLVVSFCYISKKGIYCCARYITIDTYSNDGCPLSTLMFLLVFILYPHNGWNSYDLHISLICSSQWTVAVAMHFILLKISLH